MDCIISPSPRRNLMQYKSPEHLAPPPMLLPLHSHDVVDGNDYHFEEARLRSYRNWPLDYMDPAILARAGFFYTGEGDKVTCFECHVKICQWVEGDNPMVDHQRWSARCRFIRKIPCGNVPIGIDPSAIPPPAPRSRDVCGPYGIECRLQSGPDTLSDPSDFKLTSSAKLGSLGIGKSKAPAYPEYVSYDARLRSFDSWPKCMPHSKEELANAGFYYTGKGDQTLCYHCGRGLKDWEPEDNPWEQHAKWFSKCYYLLLVKGQDYINSITGLQMSSPSKEEAMHMNLPNCISMPEASTEAIAETTSVAATKSSETLEESATLFQSTVVESNPGPSQSSQSSPLDSGFTSLELQGSSPKDGAVIKSSQRKSTVDARICKICYNEELGVIFLPCGHIVACVKCAPGMTFCAVCRKSIAMSVRVFVS
ncbi:death-associated inhibitor of apoptosis 1 isoform X2 [Cephus cinctus]|nr:death-associated inhibitor of apoptosis 1 isoform X2 [Cephus cinctus]XP_015599786.1 death-associated inhibitor of apoptosis 1 isoform X2 [Cephus cinctus]XP_024942875.1 death-associated inhibitor of apoptosis 1 isoform X2 [Cephus cinctus]